MTTAKNTIALGGLLLSAVSPASTMAQPAAAPPATTPPAAAPVAAAPAAPAAPAGPARPAYQGLRFNENWSVLPKVKDDGDLFDPIKYVPLSDDGSIWASFGGQLRMRFEAWDGFNFGAPATAEHDDVFLLTRILLHADLHIGPNVRFFVEGKSALATDRDLVGGNRTLENDHLDLQNGFGELMLPLAEGGDKITLRGGRQELLFGKQRLVSSLDWANVRRTFDAFTANIKMGDWNITPFYSQPVIVQKYDFNDFYDGDQDFYGVYATGKLPWEGIGIDLYYLGLNKDALVFNGITASPTAYNGTAGEEERHTLGGRLFGKIGETSFDYDVEGAYQFGDIGAGDISAFMFAVQLGYTFAEVTGKPRLFAGIEYGSGDESPGGDVETFNQLFPLGHAYMGWIDQLGRQNIIDFWTGVTVKPIPALTIDLHGHLFWRAQDTDGIYNAGGGLVRGPGVGLSDEVGAEIDLLIKFQLDRHTELFLGYSHFFAGEFIEESGPSDDIDFFYTGVQFTF